MAGLLLLIAASRRECGRNSNRWFGSHARPAAHRL